MINFYFLKYFYDTAKTGSVSKAAKLNRVSPSAVSQSLKKLEEDLGLNLLDHGRNRFKLTDIGASLVGHCQQVFAVLERLEVEMRVNTQSSNFKVRGISSQSLSIWLMPKLLKQLQVECPNLKFEHEIGNSRVIREKLERHEVHFAIAVDDHFLSKFNYIPIGKGKFVLVRKPGTKTSQFIIGDEGLEIRTLNELYQKKFKAQLPVLCRVQSWNTIRSYVDSGLGIGLLPEFCAHGLERVFTNWEISCYQIGIYLSPTCPMILKNGLKKFRNSFY